MPEGIADLQNADQQNADQQNADQGGGNSASVVIPPVVTPPVTGGAGTLLYCTLPLGLGVISLPGQTVTRLDWKQYQTSPRLCLTLLDANGVPINLTGAQSVTLRLLPTLGGVLLADALSVDFAPSGQVSYVFQAQDVANAGTFHLEVEAQMADGTLMYFPSDGYVLFVIHSSLGM